MRRKSRRFPAKTRRRVDLERPTKETVLLRETSETTAEDENREEITSVIRDLAASKRRGSRAREKRERERLTIPGSSDAPHGFSSSSDSYLLSNILHPISRTSLSLLVNSLIPRNLLILSISPTESTLKFLSILPPLIINPV